MGSSDVCVLSTGVPPSQKTLVRVLQWHETSQHRLEPGLSQNYATKPQTQPVALLFFFNVFQVETKFL